MIAKCPESGTFALMTDHFLTQVHLTSLALSLHYAADTVADIRAVRARVQREVADLDPHLVEDLLISALAKSTGVDPGVPQLVGRWGEMALTDAAPRIRDVLDRVAGQA